MLYKQYCVDTCVIPTEVEGFHGFRVHMYVIPTEVEGSNGTPVSASE